MTVGEKIKKISEHWFLTEPLLFAVFCSHELVTNNNLKIPFRTGKRRIEFSSSVMESFEDKDIEEYLKIEMFRILLKHPYQRQPVFPNRNVLTYASNITINDCYPTFLDLPGVGRWSLPENLCFEEYYAKVFAILCNPPEKNANCGESIISPEEMQKNTEEDDDGGNGEKQNTVGDDGCKGLQHDERETTETGVAQQHLKDFGLPGGDKEERKDKKASDITNCMKGNGGADEFVRDSSSGEAVPEQSGGMKPNGGTADSPTDREADRNALEKNQSELEQSSELWEEDQEMESSINEIIEISESSDTWGTVSGKMKSIIKASMKIDMDYRKMLSLFKTSIISNKRKLTRMRPNRRFGFLQMGSRYEMVTNLLIAVDVSGSVTDKSLSQFISVINRFFKYGIEKLDVITFDAELTSEPVELKKAKREIKVTGRGGTNFQPAADFYCKHPEYDGLIYFSDGYAPQPVFNTKRVIDVLWVLTGKREYEQHRNWIKAIKRNRATYIPLPE